MYKLGTQVLESQEVSIQTTATNLVTTRLGNRSLATTPQQRTNHEHTATKRRTLLDKLQAIEIVKLQLIALESIVVATILGHLDTDFLQQLNEVVDIEDVRHILDAHWLLGEDGGTDDLQRLVLGTLWGDGSLERMTALYDERLHRLLISFSCYS